MIQEIKPSAHGWGTHLSCCFAGRRRLSAVAEYSCRGKIRGWPERYEGQKDGHCTEIGGRCSVGCHLPCRRSEWGPRETAAVDRRLQQKNVTVQWSVYSGGQREVTNLRSSGKCGRNWRSAEHAATEWPAGQWPERSSWMRTGQPLSAPDFLCQSI